MLSRNFYGAAEEFNQRRNEVSEENRQDQKQDNAGQLDENPERYRYSEDDQDYAEHSARLRPTGLDRGFRCGTRCLFSFVVTQFFEATLVVKSGDDAPDGNLFRWCNRSETRRQMYPGSHDGPLRHAETARLRGPEATSQVDRPL